MAIRENIIAQKGKLKKEVIYMVLWYILFGHTSFVFQIKLFILIWF
jgi:hypothetical protein